MFEHTIKTAAARAAAVFFCTLFGVVVPARAQQKPASADPFDVLSQLFTYDAKLPLNVHVIAHTDTTGFTREKVVYDGWRGSRVPALIAVPRTAAARHPVVLLIDGIGGWKERWWQATSWNRGRVLIDSLIASGYAVAMADAPASGERTYENDYETAESFVGKPSQWRDMALQNTIELRRLIDYLGTRGDIDTTRVGALGLSHGGMVTFYLTSLEPRVKAGIAGLTPMHGIPDPLLPVHYAAHVAAPLLMLAGRNDAWYTVAEVNAAFALVGSKDKNVIWYDVGHRVPEAYAGDAVAWFRRYLR